MLAINSQSITVNQRNQAMNWLLANFPQAFDLCNRRPLSNCILEEILAHPKPDKPAASALKQALDFYTQWGSYLQALQAGAKRIDLHGNVCAVVDDFEASAAKATLSHSLKKA